VFTVCFGCDDDGDGEDAEKFSHLSFEISCVSPQSFVFISSHGVLSSSSLSSVLLKYAANADD